MSFDAHARGRNFKVEHLKEFLTAFKSVPRGSTWKIANNIIEKYISGYKQTHTQIAGQMGIEYKEKNQTGGLFTVHNYLFCLDNNLLKKYLEFWSMVYFAPNPRINATDPAINIFLQLAEEILSSSTNSINFLSFLSAHNIKISNEDITENSLTNHAKYIYYDGGFFKIKSSDRSNLQSLVDFIKREFPLPLDITDRKIFFDRFSEENFRKFWSFFGEEFHKSIDCNDLKHNKIIYGAPGTGKSFKLQKEAECCFDVKRIERINFYNGYTYGQFVGTYKPVPVYKDGVGKFNYRESNPPHKRDGNSEPYIVYDYIAGFFLQTLISALKDKDNKYCLIIEEINRSKVDTVFGDMFQLLDRSETGKSEYRVKCSFEMLEYIKTTELDTGVEKDIQDNGLYLPDNLYIWATMNSADQGVFPMDTAFKRRWNFEYIGLNDNAEEMKGCLVNPNDSTIGNKEWNKFRRAINKILSSEDFNVAEDKLLAPFFVKKSDFDTNNILEASVFINKVIMYLKEDVLRHRKDDHIFLDQQFSIIVDKYNKGDPIFRPSFIIELNK